MGETEIIKQILIFAAIAWMLWQIGKVFWA